MSAPESFAMLFSYTRFVVVLFLGGLFFLIAFRLVSGAINSRGLLYDKSLGGLSPARVQLLFLSLSGAFYYLMSVIELVQSGPGGPLSLPAPSNELLALVVGSNTVYLTAKAASATRGRHSFRSLFH